jgi:phospholipase/carboxylesterase
MRVEVLAPSGSSVATIIWLHGMGQEPETMMSVAHRMGLVGRGVRGVFPAAPRRGTARIRKEPVRAWFRQNVYALHKMDLRDALDVEKELRSLVASEIELAGHHRVIIAGFSQGAVAGLMLGMRYPAAIAGLMLYGCYLPGDLESLLAADRSLDPQARVWLGHGSDDYVIPLRVGEHVRDTLAAWGYPVCWQPYRTGHEAFGKVRDEAEDFLDDAVDLNRRRVQVEGLLADTGLGMS